MVNDLHVCSFHFIAPKSLEFGEPPGGQPGEDETNQRLLFDDGNTPDKSANGKCYRNKHNFRP